MKTEPNFLMVDQIACTAHEAMWGYCLATGIMLMSGTWQTATEDVKDAKRRAVRRVWENPNVSVQELHEEWVNVKVAEGWRYGEGFDVVQKLHPWLVPFGELTRDQRTQYHIFKHVVEAFRDAEAAEFSQSSPS